MMDNNLYRQVRENWNYLHPLTKALTVADYYLEKSFREVEDVYQNVLKKQKSKFFFWLPRSLAIIYITFLGIFALDVFIPDQTLGYYLTAFFIHLIPNLILLVLLIISWRHEKIGALLFLLAFLTLVIFFWSGNIFMIQVALFSPLLLISLLFFINSKQLRR